MKSPYEGTRENAESMVSMGATAEDLEKTARWHDTWGTEAEARAHRDVAAEVKRGKR